ncbi:MAG: HAMP domain-containing sensor histidine kinase [Pseudomonadota bacterium]|nr:HAMP domain-containing sensor histidine kinase [Pseudomonadota bacterium]
MPRLTIRFWRSLWARLVLLSVVLGIVPVLIYLLLQDADAERRQVLRATVAEQGAIIAAGLEPELDPARLPDLNSALSRFATPGSDLRVLYRPAGEISGFYFVGAWPAISETAFEDEKQRLLATGVLTRLGVDCAGDTETGAIYESVAGSRRTIASASAVARPNGCWVVITTRSAALPFGRESDQPYWQTPEMLVSAVIYLVMVAAIFGLFLTIRSNLQRVARLARLTGAGGGQPGFRAQNTVPELDGVAAEFDLMVAGLRRSADQLRTSAAENAHALKTPVGAIAQALEPIRRALPDTENRAHRSVDLIERAIDRLDGLIGAIRRSEEAAAELVNPHREPLDVAALARTVADSFRSIAAENRITLSVDGDRPAMVKGNAGLLTVALENPLDNALGLVPAGGSVRVSITTGPETVTLRIADTGPGVPAERLERIFDRHHTVRTPGEEADDHDGLGLWLTRRNVEALGGSVTAEPAPGGGLVIVLVLPVA